MSEKLSPAQIRKIRGEAEKRFHAAIRQARHEYSETVHVLIAEPQRVLNETEAEALRVFYEETEGCWDE